MSARYILSFLLLSFLTSYPQVWKAGADVSIGLSSGDMDYLYGPGLSLEYAFNDIPFALQGNARFTFGTSAIKFTTRSLGGRVIVYPFPKGNYSVKPYLGIGALHNWYYISDQGKSIYVTDVKNNTAYELSLGFIMNPRSHTSNYIFEFSYVQNKPEYFFRYVSNYHYDPNLLHTATYDFGTVFFKVGMLFK